MKVSPPLGGRGSGVREGVCGGGGGGGNKKDAPLALCKNKKLLISEPTCASIQSGQHPYNSCHKH